MFYVALLFFVEKVFQILFKDLFNNLANYNTFKMVKMWMFLSTKGTDLPSVTACSFSVYRQFIYHLYRLYGRIFLYRQLYIYLYTEDKKYIILFYTI